MFRSTTSPEANSFTFGSQQNPIKPQNPSFFQVSNSLDYNAGGSISLGINSGDKKLIPSRANHFPFGSQ